MGTRDRYGSRECASGVADVEPEIMETLFVEMQLWAPNFGVDNIEPDVVSHVGEF